MLPIPDLAIELSTDRAIYTPSDTAVATLTVTNRGDSAVVLRFGSGQRYEFELRDMSGALIWRWSQGRGFIQMLGSESLRAGERLVYEDRIPLPRTPGDYRLAGSLVSVDAPGRATVVLRVEE